MWFTSSWREYLFVVDSFNNFNKYVIASYTIAIFNSNRHQLGRNNQNNWRRQSTWILAHRCLTCKRTWIKRYKARQFGMHPIEIRLWQVATEANYAKTWFKYITDQMMTASETELLKRVAGMSYVFAFNPECFVFTNFDYKNWAESWSLDLTYVHFEDIKRTMGLKRTYTHIFPQDTSTTLQSTQTRSKRAASCYVKFIEKAITENIILVKLPSHTSHWHSH